MAPIAKSGVAQESSAAPGRKRGPGDTPDNRLGRSLEGIDADESQAAEDGTIEGRRADAHEVDQLAQTLPVNFAAIDLALRSYLDQIDELGGAMSDWMSSEGQAPWVVGLATLSAGCVVASRFRRRRRSEPLMFALAEGDLSSWPFDPSWTD